MAVARWSIRFPDRLFPFTLNPRKLMRNLQYYFGNPFLDPNISFAEQQAFTTDHLERLIAHNGSGDWTSQIAETTAKFSALDDSLADAQTQKAIRKAAKMAKESFRSQLPGEVRKVTALVVAEYGDPSPQLATCLPEGLTVFSQCRDDAVDEHLQTLIDGLTTLSGTIGASPAAVATTLLSNWNTIYAASEQSTADRALSEEERRAARRELSGVLFQTLLDLVKAHPDDPAALGNYMQPHLLGGPPLSPSTGGGGGGGGGAESYDSSSSSSSGYSDSSSSSSSTSSSSSGPPSNGSSSSSYPYSSSSSSSSYDSSSSSSSSSLT